MLLLPSYFVSEGWNFSINWYFQRFLFLYYFILIFVVVCWWWKKRIKVKIKMVNLLNKNYKIYRPLCVCMWVFSCCYSFEYVKGSFVSFHQIRIKPNNRIFSHIYSLNEHSNSSTGNWKRKVKVSFANQVFPPLSSSYKHIDIFM